MANRKQKMVKILRKECSSLIQDSIYLYTMYNNSKIKSDRQILVDIIAGRLISYSDENLQLNINKCTNGTIITLAAHDYIDSIKFTNTEFNMLKNRLKHTIQTIDEEIENINNDRFDAWKKVMSESDNEE